MADLVEALDNDCLIAIFVELYTQRHVYAATCFIRTCSKLRILFRDPNTGNPHYEEAKGVSLTRMPVRNDVPYPYTHQLARETTSKKRIFGFYKACEMMAMHCATECCADTRLQFNRLHGRRHVTIAPAATGVRLVASCEQSDACFFYGTERATSGSGRKATHVSVLRRIDATGTKSAQLNIAPLFIKPMQLVPSPDGKHCAMTSVDNDRVSVYVWKVEADTVCILSRPELAEGYNPQCVWWARDATDRTKWHLLVAWHDAFYDDLSVIMFRSRSAPPAKLGVYDYGTELTSAPELMHSWTVPNPPSENEDQVGWPHFQRMSGVDWGLAVMYRTYDTRGIDSDVFESGNAACFRCTVLSCTNLHPPYHLCTYNPACVYPPQALNAEFETVNLPIAMALSPSGMHVALLAVNFRHEWDKPINKPFVCLALYSWDPKLKSFVKTLGPKDYLCITLVGYDTKQSGWEIVFSPCGAYITLVYAKNRYGFETHTLEEYPKPRGASEPAVHVIHIHPTLGLRRAQPVDCPTIRQLSWNDDALLVMPKHGAVFIR